MVNESGTVEQVTHYYPFGGVFDDASTGQSLQPYKYNGKELDRMHGLDTYDYGARQYYAPAMRWDRVDPLAEGKNYHASPYVYCADNPVRFLDLLGKEPGDHFVYPTQAALDFGRIYNSHSILKDMEYFSFIYKLKDYNGNIYYSYAYPVEGTKNHITKKAQKKIDNSCINAKDVVDIVATIHTHGDWSINSLYNNDDYNNKFSGEQKTPSQNLIWKGEKGRSSNSYIEDDISGANRTKTYSYLVTPNGALKGYDPKTGIVRVWSTQMPSSEKAGPFRLNKINPQKDSFIDKILKKIR